MNSKMKRGPGRPPQYEGDRKPITIQWPVDLIEYIDSVTDNRTKWLIEAAQEKREREEAEKALFHGKNTKQIQAIQREHK